MVLSANLLETIVGYSLFMKGVTMRNASFTGWNRVIAMGCGVGLGFLGLGSSLALGQSENIPGPPTPSANHEDPEAPYKKLKTADPDWSRADKGSGVFLGAGIGVGQAQPTSGGTSPGLAFKAYFEPGYQRQMTSWSRMEFGGEVFSGALTFRRNGTDTSSYSATVPLGLGLLVKAGYGYSLGGDAYGTWKVGLGPVFAKYKASGDEFSESSKSTVWGTAAQLGFILGVPASEALSFQGGINLTHYNLDIGDVERTAGGFTATSSEGSVNLNVWEATFGMRYRL